MMTKPKTENEAIESTVPDVRKRIGFLDGKYPPMSLEDFNASNDEIASWFYEGEIDPEAEAPEGNS